MLILESEKFTNEQREILSRAIRDRVPVTILKEIANPVLTIEEMLDILDSYKIK